MLVSKKKVSGPTTTPLSVWRQKSLLLIETISQAPPHVRQSGYKETFRKSRGSRGCSEDTKTPKTERPPVHASCYAEDNEAYSAPGRNLSTEHTHTHSHIYTHIHRKTTSRFHVKH